MRHSATCGLCGGPWYRPRPIGRHSWGYAHSGAVRLRVHSPLRPRGWSPMISPDTFEELPPPVYELLADLSGFDCLRGADYDSDEGVLTIETLPGMSAMDTHRLYLVIEDTGFELEQLDHLVDGYSIAFKMG